MNESISRVHRSSINADAVKSHPHFTIGANCLQPSVNMSMGVPSISSANRIFERPDRSSSICESEMYDLVSLWKRHRMGFAYTSKKNKAYVYRAIAEDLTKMGYPKRSHQEIMRKILKLRSQHRILSSNGNQESWKYYDLVNDVVYAERLSIMEGIQEDGKADIVEVDDADHFEDEESCDFSPEISISGVNPTNSLFGQQAQVDLSICNPRVNFIDQRSLAIDPSDGPFDHTGHSAVPNYGDNSVQKGDSTVHALSCATDPEDVSPVSHPMGIALASYEKQVGLGMQPLPELGTECKVSLQSMGQQSEMNEQVSQLQSPSSRLSGVSSKLACDVGNEQLLHKLTKNNLNSFPYKTGRNSAQSSGPACSKSSVQARAAPKVKGRRDSLDDQPNGVISTDATISGIRSDLQCFMSEQMSMWMNIRQDYKTILNIVSNNHRHADHDVVSKESDKLDLELENANIPCHDSGFQRLGGINDSDCRLWTANVEPVKPTSMDVVASTPVVDCEKPAKLVDIVQNIASDLSTMKDQCRMSEPSVDVLRDIGADFRKLTDAVVQLCNVLSRKSGPGAV